MDALKSIPGVRLAAVCAGIKKPCTGERDDLVLIEAAAGSTIAAMFTRNAFCAAPVQIAREHLAAETPRYLLINSGNANAGTGAPGREAALSTCRGVATLASCAPEQVLPFSTGVIGEPLPVAHIEQVLPELYQKLAADQWPQAARAIMTTDTVPKAISRTVEIDGETIIITGIAKGAGMIRPDMATMLAFIATDARLSKPIAEKILRKAVDRSFNRITVDGDTSTNDSCVLIASGQSKLPSIDNETNSAFANMQTAITDVCTTLAQAIVRDGEGATKFITITVNGGRDPGECLKVAYAVAHSPLVKTALFASDPNWGRILAATGRAGVTDLDVNKVIIHLGDICIVRNGGRAPDYREELGAEVLAKPEIMVTIDLQRGNVSETVWTCDFSYDYVRINADYRT
jgi:glutamate N-acetyltransferase/amino-acid N-acetyltransferase